MGPKTIAWTPIGVHFVEELLPCGVFGAPLGSFGVPLGLLWTPLVLPWAPFGATLA